jgi:hypothetical protein
MINGNTRDMTKFYMNMFLYGQWGSGKSWFLGTMPKPYLIVTERLPMGLGIAGKAIDYVKVESMEDLHQVMDEIALGKRAAGAESIGLDSLSDLTPLIIEHVLAQQKKQRMTLECWGIAVDYVRVFVRKLIELGKTRHIAITAKAIVTKDELTGATMGVPETIGKFAYVVPGMFDEVFYCQQDTSWVNGKQITSWKMNTVGVANYPAKDGLGVLAPVEPNDFSTIYAKVLAKTMPQVAANK